MSTRIKKTYGDAILEMIERYKAEGHTWPATAWDMAIWAKENNLWQAPPEFITKKLAKDIAKALASATHIDDQGREVRSLVAAAQYEEGEEGEKRRIFRWEYVREGTSEFLVLAADQQRKQIIGDCRSLNTWVQSANENNPNLRSFQIQLDWDFTDEVLQDNDMDTEINKPR